jgi:hypothetical protein
MAVNGCPFLAVQTHVPPENLVVCNSNKLLAVLRVTDAVQAHVITSALPTAYCALIFHAKRDYEMSRLKGAGAANILRAIEQERTLS